MEAAGAAVAGDSDPGQALAPQPEEIGQLFTWGGDNYNDDNGR